MRQQQLFPADNWRGRRQGFKDGFGAACMQGVNDERTCAQGIERFLADQHKGFYLRGVLIALARGSQNLPQFPCGRAGCRLRCEQCAQFFYIFNDAIQAGRRLIMHGDIQLA